MTKCRRTKTEITDDYIVFSTQDEYPGSELEEKWIVASDLTEGQLLNKYGAQIQKYQPYIAVTMEQGRAMHENNCYESSTQRLEHRHCISLDQIEYEGTNYGREDEKLTKLLRNGESEDSEHVLSVLNPRQAELVRAIYIDGLSATEYARRKGVTKSAISHQINTIKNKLKKFL